MCFRPAGAARALQCPECGTFNRPGNTECQKCGMDFKPLLAELEAQDSAAMKAPSAPGNAPQAPGNAPKAPGNAPAAPGNAPRVPGNAPKASGKQPWEK
jgi:hypothetical protein